MQSLMRDRKNAERAVSRSIIVTAFEEQLLLAIAMKKQHFSLNMESVHAYTEESISFKWDEVVDQLKKRGREGGFEVKSSHGKRGIEGVFAIRTTSNDGSVTVTKKADMNAAYGNVSGTDETEDTSVQPNFVLVRNESTKGVMDSWTPKNTSVERVLFESEEEFA